MELNKILFVFLIIAILVIFISCSNIKEGFDTWNVNNYPYSYIWFPLQESTCSQGDSSCQNTNAKFVPDINVWDTLAPVSSFSRKYGSRAEHQAAKNWYVSPYAPNVPDMCIIPAKIDTKCIKDQYGKGKSYGTIINFCTSPQTIDPKCPS
jgi:hypothetical protein